MKGDIILRNYVPAESLDSNYFHDSEWLWGVIYALKKEWALDYYEGVLNYRNKSKIVGRADKVLQLSQDWIDKLAKYDYKSSSKYHFLVNFLCSEERPAIRVPCKERGTQDSEEEKPPSIRPLPASYN